MKHRVFSALVCAVFLVLTSSALANLCLFSNRDTTPIDPNSGFPNSTPLRGQVLTGYPDLAGSYSTRMSACTIPQPR